MSDRFDPWLQLCLHIHYIHLLLTNTMQTKAVPGRASTLVIGGGPAGIVSLKYIQEYGPQLGLQGEDDGEQPVLVEMEAEIGGTFR
jgi:cation diffusion facilitator CzcD-associated flavoprotein CzcO